MNYSSIRTRAQNYPYFNERHDRAYILSASLSPGFAYRLNRKLVVDAFLANFLTVSDTYTKSKEQFANTNAITSYNNAISFNTGLSGFSLSNIQIGFRFIL